jgi:hypothetical protein
MSSVPISPKLLRAGLVLVDAASSAVQRVIVLQYNPETLSRTLEPMGVGEDAERSEQLRLKGPPVETISLEAELDATDQLEVADGTAVEVGLYPQLAALETILYPSSSQLQANHQLERSGTLEITPTQAPLALFVWSKNRILPVRITEFSITEEAFDVNLNPTRASVSLGMRVLSVWDLGFEHKGGSLYMVYQQQKERLAGKALSTLLAPLGIGGIP